MNNKLQNEPIKSTPMDYVLTLIYDLLSSPLNVVLLSICCYLLYKIYKLRTTEVELPVIKKKKIIKRNLTLEQLREFDGVKNESIIIALNGKLYDVTSGANFYGPSSDFYVGKKMLNNCLLLGGPYGCLAGRDATRALATFCLDNSSLKDDYDDISDLSPSEMDQMKEWEMQFESKYYVIGKLLRSGEVCEIIDTDEDENSAPGELLETAIKWSSNDKSPSVSLSENKSVAYFHVDPIFESNSTAGIRSNIGFNTGMICWKFSLLEPPLGTSVMVGVGTKKAPLHFGDYFYVNLIGYDDQSWGLSYKGLIWHNGIGKQFCPAFYSKYTTIRCRLNLLDGTLRFQFDEGDPLLAFQGVFPKSGEPLFAMASSTAAGMEIAVTNYTCSLNSLQELCLSVIFRCCNSKNFSKLPIPDCLKELLATTFCNA